MAKEIKTPDYIFQGEKWDLKELKNATSRTRAVDNVIKDKEKQSTNFILDITNCKLSDEIIIKQAERILNSLYRNWIQKIIIKRDNNLVKIIKRK